MLLFDLSERLVRVEDIQEFYDKCAAQPYAGVGPLQHPSSRKVIHMIRLSDVDQRLFEIYAQENHIKHNDILSILKWAKVNHAHCAIRSRIFSKKLKYK